MSMPECFKIFTDLRTTHFNFNVMVFWFSLCDIQMEKVDYMFWQLIKDIVIVMTLNQAEFQLDWKMIFAAENCEDWERKQADSDGQSFITTIIGCVGVWFHTTIQTIHSCLSTCS